MATTPLKSTRNAMFKTPLRVANGESLQRMPNELHLEIFGYIDHATSWLLRIQTLKSLALVCRYFHSLAVPRLFRTLQIMRTESPSEAMTASSTIFCTSILRGLEPASSFACHVQNCSISWWQDHRNRNALASDGFVKVFGDVLGYLPNLQSLTVASVTVSEEFLKAICRHRFLKYLSLRSVLVQVQYDDDDLLEPRTGVIKALSLINVKFSPIESMDAAMYMIDLGQLKSLTVNNRAVARRIFKSMKTSALVKLVVDCSVPYSILWDVLEISGSLEILELRNFTPSEPPPPLPALPRLWRLACPSFMLHFVSGHPISSIEVTTDVSLDEIATDKLSLMQGSSAALKDISVLFDFYRNTPIFEAFPHIERLRIDIEKWTPEKETGLGTIVREVTSRCPQVIKSLLSFSLEDTFRPPYPTDTETQLDLLSQLTLVFPNLRTARLVKYTQWRRVTIKDGWIYNPRAG